MPKGGARTRSGPPKDPKSRTSERAGYTVAALPPEGYRKQPPGLNQYLPKPTARHREVWSELWRTPQACAWSMERWRWPVVADLCRQMVRLEHRDCPVTVVTAVRQLRDDLGLSTAGLRLAGWQIGEATPTQPTAPAAEDEDDPRSRFRVVS